MPLKLRLHMENNRWMFLRKIGTPARISFWTLVLLGVLALLAPWISPDGTPDANRQEVRIRTCPPLQPIEFLVLASAKDGTWGNRERIPLLWHEETGGELRYVVWDQPEDTVRLEKHAAGGMQLIRRTFWLGSDLMGRDMLSRILLGMRITLKIGVFAVLVSLLFGISLGMLAGYFGGRTDMLLTWVMQVVWSVPSIMLVIAFSLAMGRGAWQVYLAVGLTLWVDVARLVRGEVRRLREQEFVQAARVLGFGPIRIMLNHLLPNMAGPVLIMAAAQFATAILVESGLSFLGLGIQPPTPSLGMMIREHYPYILTQSAWLAIVPGLVISAMVLACNLLSTGLSDYVGRVGENS